MSASSLIFGSKIRFCKVLFKSTLPIRESHIVSYRAAPPPHSKLTKITAVAVGGAMWWWVIWHLWHEPDHITGEFDFPNSLKWSNADLGIPRDDASA